LSLPHTTFVATCANATQSPGDAVTRGVRYILVGFVEIRGGQAGDGPSVREQVAEENEAAGVRDDPDDPELDYQRLKRYWDTVQRA
jgi:hypothetical protein